MEKLKLAEKLDKLQKQSRALVDAYQQLKREKEDLISQKALLKAKTEALQGQLSDFQNQDKITKIVSNTTVEKEESAELKNKLNEYIKEIDRCIAHLGH